MADVMGVGLIGPGWVASEHIRAFNKKSAYAYGGSL